MTIMVTIMITITLKYHQSVNRIEIWPPSKTKPSNSSFTPLRKVYFEGTTWVSNSSWRPRGLAQKSISQHMHRMSPSNHIKPIARLKRTNKHNQTYTHTHKYSMYLLWIWENIFNTIVHSNRYVLEAQNKLSCGNEAMAEKSHRMAHGTCHIVHWPW